MNRLGERNYLFHLQSAEGLVECCNSETLTLAAAYLTNCSMNIININLAEERELHAITEAVETALSAAESKIISKLAYELLTKTASPSINSLLV